MGRIALLVAGLIIQFGNKESKEQDTSKVQISVESKMSDSFPPKPSTSIYPQTGKHQVQKEVDQKQPVDNHALDAKGFESASDKCVIKPVQQSSSQAEVFISEEAIPDNRPEAVHSALYPETETLKASETSGSDVKR